MSNCINCGTNLTFLNSTDPLFPGTKDTFCTGCEKKLHIFVKSKNGAKITEGLIEDNKNLLRQMGFNETSIEYLKKYAAFQDPEYLRKQEEKRNEKKREGALLALNEKFKSSQPGAIFHIDGARGRSIDIFPHKCVISVDTTLGSVVTGNATDGEKTVYYGDCIGLQFKKPGITIGYLQFETASTAGNNSHSNFFNENTFTYEKSDISELEMALIVEYVKDRLDIIKLRQYGTGLE